MSQYKEPIGEMNFALEAVDGWHHIQFKQPKETSLLKIKHSFTKGHSEKVIFEARKITPQSFSEKEELRFILGYPQDTTEVKSELRWQGDWNFEFALGPEYNVLGVGGQMK